MKEPEQTNYASAEIPRLELHKSRTISDFEVESLTLVATGWTAAEAKKNMEYLLAEVEKK